ncbi:MAG: hypothetical protein ACRERS_01195, partial [Methylococcales bacterium]
MDYEGLKNKLAGVSSQALSTDSNVAAMLAAQAKAMVEARFIMAMHRPRSWDDVRVRLLDECRRPAFAANPSAYYVKPVGKGAEGLGIRFVEVALRCMSNVLVETMTLHDDERARLLRVSVTDLESNETLGKDITVAKTVERSKPLDDGTYISVRTNSSGYKTYTVPATDDDMLNKEGSLVSKAIRTLGLRIIPGDLQDEAEAIILKIRNTKTAADPAAERKNLADSFSKLNVLPSALTEYLGHDFGQCSPAELVTLRGLYGAIKDGETSWAAAIEDAQSSRSSKLEHGEFPKQREDGSWVDGAGVLFDAAIHGLFAMDSRPSVIYDW